MSGHVQDATANIKRLYDKRYQQVEARYAYPAIVWYDLFTELESTERKGYVVVLDGLNYLDRTSLAFASIQLTQDLKFSPTTYGLASGLFFLTYCIMQIPSNICCMLLGVRKWLTVIMFTWGVVAALFAAVQHPWQFYLLRLLLGLAEAGTFPGIWYAMSLWYPNNRVSVPYSMLAVAVAISQVLAAPLAAALLKLDGVGGLAGWQWLFIAGAHPEVAAAG
eukprot:gene14249-14397_t